MNHIHEVVTRITVLDVINKYGIQRTRGGFIRCPFHADKTASMIVNDDFRSAHCFGCGTTKDSFQFVKDYFGLTTRQALVRMNNDFNLCLPLNKPLTLREERDSAKAETARKEAREAEYAQTESAADDYHKWLSVWCFYDKCFRLFAPESPDDERHPLFVEAALNIDITWHRVIEAETRWNELARLQRNNNTRLDGNPIPQYNNAI